MELKISCFELKTTPRKIQSFLVDKDVSINSGANDCFLTLSGSFSEVYQTLHIIKENGWFEK